MCQKKKRIESRKKAVETARRPYSPPHVTAHAIVPDAVCFPGGSINVEGGSGRPHKR